MKTRTQNTKANKLRLTVTQSAELHRLKRQINDSAEAVESLVKSVKDKSRQALAEALTCGKALLRVKEIVKFGGFEKWCADNCKKITNRTVQKYIKLAKANVDSDLLATGIGLQQAYISLGVLKEDDSEPTETSNVSNNNGDSRTVTFVGGRAMGKSTINTPVANATAKAQGKSTTTSVTPEISKADHLSRARFLTNELLRELNSKITIKGVTLSDLQSTTLKPIADWFEQQK